MIHSFSVGAYNRRVAYTLVKIRVVNVIQMIQDQGSRKKKNMTCSAYDVLVYCTSTVSVSHNHTKNREDQVSTAVRDRSNGDKLRTVRTDRRYVDDTGTATSTSTAVCY